MNTGLSVDCFGFALGTVDPESRVRFHDSRPNGAELWKEIEPPQRKDCEPDIRTMVRAAGQESEAFRSLLSVNCRTN